MLRCYRNTDAVPDYCTFHGYISKEWFWASVCDVSFQVEVFFNVIFDFLLFGDTIYCSF